MWHHCNDDKHWANLILLYLYLSQWLDSVFHSIYKTLRRCQFHDEMFPLLPVQYMMTSPNGNTSRVTGPLYGKFTGSRWIPHTKASDAEPWCFLWFAWINGWENNREAGDLRRHGAHSDVIVMIPAAQDCHGSFRNISIEPTWSRHKLSSVPSHSC